MSAFISDDARACALVPLGRKKQKQERNGRQRTGQCLYIAFFYVFDSPFLCGSPFLDFLFFLCFTGCQCLLLRSLCGSSCLSAIGHNRKRAYPHATAAMYSVMVSALYSHVTSLTSLYTSGFQAGNATPSKGRFTSFFFFFSGSDARHLFFSVFLYLFISSVSSCCIWDGKPFLSVTQTRWFILNARVPASASALGFITAQE